MNLRTIGLCWLGVVLIFLAFCALGQDSMVPPTNPPLYYIAITCVSNGVESAYSAELSNRGPCTVSYDSYYVGNTNVTYRAHVGVHSGHYSQTYDLGTNLVAAIPQPFFIKPVITYCVSSGPFIIQKAPTPNGPWTSIASNYVMWTTLNPVDNAIFRVYWQSNTVTITPHP